MLWLTKYQLSALVISPRPKQQEYSSFQSVKIKHINLEMNQWCILRPSKTNKWKTYIDMLHQVVSYQLILKRFICTAYTSPRFISPPENPSTKLYKPRAYNRVFILDCGHDNKFLNLQLDTSVELWEKSTKRRTASTDFPYCLCIWRNSFEEKNWYF